LLGLRQNRQNKHPSVAQSGVDFGLVAPDSAAQLALPDVLAGANHM
jgi:hypothetical protein